MVTRPLVAARPPPATLPEAAKEALLIREQNENLFEDAVDGAIQMLAPDGSSRLHITPNGGPRWERPVDEGGQAHEDVFRILQQQAAGTKPGGDARRIKAPAHTTVAAARAQEGGGLGVIASSMRIR